VIKDILGENPRPVAYDRVPWAIYCHPEVAFAGPSEEAAREAGAAFPFAEEAEAILAEAEQHGLGEQDFAALVEVLEARAGAKL